MSRFALAVLVLCSTLVTGAKAGPGDEEKKGSLLSEVEKRQQLARQAFEVEISAILKRADSLADEPERALDLLRSALKKLEGVTPLPIVRQAELRLTLRRRIEQLEKRLASKGDPAKADREAKREQLRSQRQAEQIRQAELKRDLAILKSLVQRGKTGEAARLAASLARRYPDNPSVVEALKQNQFGNVIRSVREFNSEKAVASRSSLASVVKAGVPIADDIVYPPNWNKLSKERRKRYLDRLFPMTEKEREIIRSLNQMTKQPIVLKDEPLDRIIDFLQKLIGQPLLVNNAALRDQGIDYESRCTLTLPKNISKRSALRSILAEFGLTYVVRGETIHVTDLERARSMLVVRFFTVDDLLMFGGNFGLGGDGLVPPAEQLIDLIQDTIDPLSWEKHGGPGSIRLVGRILVVRNSAEVINMLGGGRTSR